MRNHRLLLLTAPLLLAGCSEIQKLTTPPLSLSLELKGVAGAEVRLVLSGSGSSETYTDNGAGLQTAATVWPGRYTASLSELAQGPIRYAGVLEYSNASGNYTRQGSMSFDVRDHDAGKLKLKGSYQPVTGSLQVTASGLPFGARAAVFYRASGQEEAPFDPERPAALEPGSYLLRFGEVAAEGQTYRPQATQAVVAVEAGKLTPVSVSYEAMPAAAGEGR
ncbi:hypothetical protein Mrose_03515 [Calidithermus roseus]|uniref:Lipoprotein n=2 Tax=Calidithermus roseus TaxID=1644118 RepID=A0A399ED60_9DEIN|nr:hypothetical protein Mrose_03515 [Calidithermus roseus]